MQESNLAKSWTISSILKNMKEQKKSIPIAIHDLLIIIVKCMMHNNISSWFLLYMYHDLCFHQFIHPIYIIILHIYNYLIIICIWNNRKEESYIRVCRDGKWSPKICKWIHFFEALLMTALDVFAAYIYYWISIRKVMIIVENIYEYDLKLNCQSLMDVFCIWMEIAYWIPTWMDLKINLYILFHCCARIARSMRNVCRGKKNQ